MKNDWLRCFVIVTLHHVHFIQSLLCDDLASSYNISTIFIPKLVSAHYLYCLIQTRYLIIADIYYNKEKVNYQLDNITIYSTAGYNFLTFGNRDQSQITLMTTTE